MNSDDQTLLYSRPVSCMLVYMKLNFTAVDKLIKAPIDSYNENQVAKFKCLFLRKVMNSAECTIISRISKHYAVLVLSHRIFILVCYVPKLHQNITLTSQTRRSFPDPVDCPRCDRFFADHRAVLRSKHRSSKIKISIKVHRELQT
jgi:hypothetical protein